MDIKHFKKIMLSGTNAPLVTYLHHKGLTQEEIIKELNKTMKHYAMKIFQYSSNGNQQGKSDSQKLLSITQKTKNYITEKGLEAIKDMEGIADSQLEEWCQEPLENQESFYNQN